MHIFVALLLFFGPPFWEAKQPSQWSDAEISQILTSSPWTQTATPEPLVKLFLATARPIEDAEAELRLRGSKDYAEPDPEFAEYVSRNRDSQVVLAIDYRKVRPDWPEGSERQMQDESMMLVGRRKHRMTGYFPPTPADPVLRISFPRDVTLSDRRVLFRLYLPGITFPERDVEFNVKDLVYRGKLEM